MTEMKDLEAIIGTLKKEATPARPEMWTYAENVLYANSETGTVVLEVRSAKSGQPHGTLHKYNWTYYLAGNEHGYGKSTCQGPAGPFGSKPSLGPIMENDTSVTIKQYGSVPTLFSTHIPVGDIVLDKSKFTPYGST